MCHDIIRYWEEIGGPGVPQLFHQRQVWQRSLESVPVGRDVLYNSDMVTLTALLSQHTGNTVAYTSIVARFMISALLPPFLSFCLPPLFLFPTPSTSLPSTCHTRVWKSVCVFERQLLRCITPAILHRWIGLVLRHTVLMYGISFIPFLPSVFIIAAAAEHQGLFSQTFLIWFNKKPFAAPILFQLRLDSVWLFSWTLSLIYFAVCHHSAQGPQPPVAPGGVESRLHPAGLRRQHRHRAPLRPHGQRTVRHPAGNCIQATYSPEAVFIASWPGACPDADKSNEAL